MSEGRGRSSEHIRDENEEQRLWRCLTHERLSRYVFYRKFPINPYVVDFFCPGRGVVVQLDATRDPQRVRYETQRRAALEALGYRVLWIDPDALRTSPEAVVNAVADAMEEGASS